MKKNESLEAFLYRIGQYVLILGLPAMGFYVFFMQKLPHIPCVLDYLFHIYCPGCGGTRAILAIFQGKIFTSLWYHPIVLYTIIMYFGFMISHTLEKLHWRNIKGWKFHAWYLYLALAIVVCNCILKNMLRLIWSIEMI